MNHKIEQTAGVFKIVCETSGWPVWTSISDGKDEIIIRSTELHDLKYCIDRAMAQLTKAQLGDSCD